MELAVSTPGWRMKPASSAAASAGPLGVSPAVPCVRSLSTVSFPRGGFSSGNTNSNVSTTPSTSSSSISLSSCARGITSISACASARVGGGKRGRVVAAASVDVGSAPVEAEEGDDEEECEVVNGFEVVLGEGVSKSLAPTDAQAGAEAGSQTEGEGDERFSGYLVQPLKNSNGTGVLLLPDVMGQASKETREFAYRLSCFGYSVLVADLYRGVPWASSRPKEEYEAWREEHAGPPSRVAQDIATAAKFLSSHLVQLSQLSGADPEAGVQPRMAVLGFCFGGGRVLEELARDGERGVHRQFATGVSFYGTRMDPKAVAGKVKVPVFFVTGDEDPLCSVEEVRGLAAGIPGSEVQVYAGRGHAFVHRPNSMDEDEDAEKAFQAARHWLHTHLLPDHPVPQA